MKQVIIMVLLLLVAPTIVQAVELPPPDPERSAIGVTVRGKFAIGNKAPAVQVYFVRLDEDVDKFSADYVIQSNFSKKKQVYLLNCKPGRYVVVAAELRSSGNSNVDYKVYFGMNLISQTEIAVEAGEMAFMGDFVVDLKGKMNLSDKAQSQYFRLVDPNASRKGTFRRALTGSYAYRGDLVHAERTPETEASFWTIAAKKVFKRHPAWAAKVKEQQIGN